MKLLKNALYLSLALGLYTSSALALIGDGVDTRSVADLNVPAPEDIAEIQAASNREINYMLDNYSTPQLAREAIRLNKAQIAAAQKSGITPPARLSKEMLSDRNKLADYLRSQYKFSY